VISTGRSAICRQSGGVQWWIFKNKGRRGIWRLLIDSPGCEDHAGSLGLFREALQDEIRPNKNPIVGWWLWLVKWRWEEDILPLTLTFVCKK
jgi:hypothetical protein